jgi:hypothetical protein
MLFAGISVLAPIFQGGSSSTLLEVKKRGDDAWEFLAVRDE